MRSKLVLVSNKNERLTIRPDTNAIFSVPAQGDGFSAIVLEQSTQIAITTSESSPVPDIVMSFVAGLPTGLSQSDVQSAETLRHDITMQELTVRLNSLSPGTHKIFKLGTNDGR